MDSRRTFYVSYLLRLWVENDRYNGYHQSEAVGWRASLQDPHTQDLLVFVDLEALFAFLLAETARRAPGEGDRPHEAGEANKPAHVPGT